MNLKNIPAGMGVGVFAALLVVVKLMPDYASISSTWWVYLLGALIGGLIFAGIKWEFKCSSIAYAGGLGAILLALTLSGVWFSRGMLFTVITLSIAPLYLEKPSGIADVLLSGLTYFGGALTGMAIIGAAGFLDEPRMALGAIFIGVIGAIGSFMMAALLLVMRSHLKP
ncbi:hypothetical protein [Thermococcus sp. Bubb.Bath]|uniref:hypothetical protein n=1 Tax=Thermococcus sp. Bubb.Bath TaxID=1638242 RepID=UPI001438C11A|nr:hypothetical protein [Thermococcus sp. Bubb.Bath]NJF24368.1 hypothetical protein [Thermococcus sp. Bubb.Bath]